MTILELKAELAGKFSINLDDFRDNPDRVNYLEAPLENISELCGYIHQTLGYPLVLMFANDEQILQGVYAVYYVFADRDEGTLLVLKTKVEPRVMETRHTLHSNTS